MNKSTDINNMTISLNNEYRKILKSILEDEENEILDEVVTVILAAWDAKVSEVSETIVSIVGTKEKKTRKGTKESGPKKPMSAYLYFCKEKRAEVKAKNPEMKATEITSELGQMWREVKDTQDAEQYMVLANADKDRYNSEKVDAPPKEPKEPKEKKQRKQKVSTKVQGPKKPMSAYLYFCQEKREQVKAENPEMKPKEITAELGRLWNKIKETPKANKYKDQAEDAKAQYAETAGAAKTHQESDVVSSGEEQKEEAPKKGKKLPKAKEEKAPTTGYQLFCKEEGEGIEKKELRKQWFAMKKADPARFQDYELRVATHAEPDEDSAEQEAKAEPDEDSAELDDTAELDEEEATPIEEDEPEDPALVDARALLNYLEEIKSNRPKKDVFLEQVESLENLSSEIKSAIERIKKLRGEVISIPAIEKLSVLCNDTIKSYEL